MVCTQILYKESEYSVRYQIDTHIVLKLESKEQECANAEHNDEKECFVKLSGHKISPFLNGCFSHFNRSSHPYATQNVLVSEISTVATPRKQAAYTPQSVCDKYRARGNGQYINYLWKKALSDYEIDDQKACHSAYKSANKGYSAIEFKSFREDCLCW